MYMKSGGGLGPAAPLCHGRCETDGVGETDGEDSSELRQGRQSKPHSPCRAGPFPSKNGCDTQWCGLEASRAQAWATMSGWRTASKDEADLEAGSPESDGWEGRSYHARYKA
jgi:hypothetical protein